MVRAHRCSAPRETADATHHTDTRHCTQTRDTTHAHAHVPHARKPPRTHGRTHARTHGSVCVRARVRGAPTAAAPPPPAPPPPPRRHDHRAGTAAARAPASTTSISAALSSPPPPPPSQPAPRAEPMRPGSVSAGGAVRMAAAMAVTMGLGSSVVMEGTLRGDVGATRVERAIIALSEANLSLPRRRRSGDGPRPVNSLSEMCVVQEGRKCSAGPPT